MVDEEIETWPTVSGVVISSTYVMEETDYIPKILYNYTVDGDLYISSKISFHDISFENIEEIEDYLRNYQSNTIILVHYNPKDPSMALIDIEYSYEYVNYLGFIVLGIIISTTLLVGVYFEKERNNEKLKYCLKKGFYKHEIDEIKANFKEFKLKKDYFSLVTNRSKFDQIDDHKLTWKNIKNKVYRNTYPWGYYFALSAIFSFPYILVILKDILIYPAIIFDNSFLLFLHNYSNESFEIVVIVLLIITWLVLEIIFQRYWTNRYNKKAHFSFVGLIFSIIVYVFILLAVMIIAFGIVVWISVSLLLYLFFYFIYVVIFKFDFGVDEIAFSFLGCMLIILAVTSFVLVRIQDFNKTIAIINSERNNYSQIFIKNGTEVTAVDQDDQYLAFSYNKGKTYVYQKDDVLESTFIQETKISASNLVINDNYLITLTKKGKLSILDIENELVEVRTLSLKVNGLTSMVQIGYNLIIGDLSGKIWVLNKLSLEVVSQLNTELSIISMDSIDHYLVICSRDGHISQYELANNSLTLKKSVKTENEYNTLTSSDQYICISNTSNQVVLYRSKDLSEFMTLKSESNVTSMAISDEYLYAGNSSGGLQVWEISTEFTQTKIWTPHVLAIDIISLYNRSLVTGSVDSTLKQYDTVSKLGLYREFEYTESTSWLSTEQINLLQRCQICKDFIEANEEWMSCTKCGFNYHKDEIKSWLRIRPICPVCRGKITSN